MAKRREAVRPSGSVPAELLDPDASVWRSDRAAADWLEGHGLAWVDRMSAGPLNRRKWAAIGWARANGWTRTLANGCVLPDWRRMREAGICRADGASMVERLRHGGVDV